MKRHTTVLYIAACTLYFILGGRGGLFLNCAVKILPLIILLTGMLFILAGNEPHHGKEKTAFIFGIAALVFSMTGDIFGEMKHTPAGNDAFLWQIISFAAAHICYISSFVLHLKKDTSSRRNIIRGILIMSILTFLICFAAKVSPLIENNSIRTVVPIYATFIGLMGISAVMQYREGLWWFVIGALLFIFSDSMIAYRSFIGHLPNAGLLIMSTYYAAQFFLNHQLLNSKCCTSSAM